MPSYLARPDSSGPAPAVIVLQEIFGVNAEIRRIADLVADSGYVALAINYYHRTNPDLDVPYNDEGRNLGVAAAAKVTRETIRDDIYASVDWLNAQDFVKFNHIATWGFCHGGSMAFLSSMLHGISGAVVFYGGQIGKPLFSGGKPPIEEADEVRAPLLLVYGGEDHGIPMDEVQRIERALHERKKRFALQIYSDQGHGFFRESSQSMDKKDVADAWDRVQAFLKKTLV
jgi:carboxymethylenebutenolidase